MADVLTELVAKIKTDASGLTGGLTDAEGKVETSSKRMANSFVKIGKAAVVAGGIAVIAFAGKALKSAVEFEDQMANVAKTTGLTGDALKEVQDGIQGLARKMPVAHEELAGIAAVAGQLGVQGKEDIVSFTETAAMMATAFDMSGEEAATAMAKLANIYDIPIQQTDKLASAINVLGNTTAAKEGEIIAAMSKVGASGKMLGLLETQVAAMTDVIIASGMAPERAGTQLRSAFTSMTSNVDKAAGVMGISVDEMTEKFDTDFHGALIDLLNTLETKYPSATQRMAAMSELFGETGSKAMSVLSTDTEGYLEVLGRAEQVYQENTALQEEYANKTDTMAASLQKLSNLFNDISIVVGEKLYPLIEPLVEQFGKLLEALPVDEIAEFLNTALQPLVSFISVLLEVLKPLFPVLEPIGKLFAMLAETLAPFLEKLLPPLIELIGALVEILVPLLELVLALLEPFLDLITYIVPPLISLLAKLLNLAIKPLTIAVRWLIDHALKPLKDIFAEVGKFSDTLFGKIVKLIGGSPGFLGLGEAAEWTSGVIANKFAPALNDITNKTNDAKKATDELTDSYTKLGEEAEKSAEKVAISWGTSLAEIKATKEGGGKASLTEYIGSKEGTAEVYGRMAEGGISKKQAISDMQKEVYGFGLPGYAKGGFVNETGPALLHAGETVIPANESMGGVTVNFSGPLFMEREDQMNQLVDKIRKGIDRSQRLRFGGAYSG